MLKIEGGNGESEKKEGIKYFSPEVQEKYGNFNLQHCSTTTVCNTWYQVCSHLAEITIKMNHQPLFQLNKNCVLELIVSEMK